MAEPRQSRRAREARGDHVPVWVQVVGACFVAATLIFLMYLSVRDTPIPCGNRFIVTAILALTVSGAFGFLGGSAAMKGKLPLPGGLRSHPIAVSLAGGVAVFAIILVLGWWMYARDCSEETSKPRITRVDASLAETGDLSIELGFQIPNVKPGETGLVRVGSDEALSESLLWLPPQPLDDWRQDQALIGVGHRTANHGWIRIDIVDGQGRLIAASQPYRFEIPRAEA